MVKTKICTNPECFHLDGPELPLTEFPIDSKKPDGYRARCKKCVSTAAKLRYKTNEISREAKKLSSSNYRKKNHEIVKAKKRAAYHANPEKSKEYRQKWYAENREYAIAKAVEYERNRTKIDPSYKLMKRLRNRLYSLVSGKDKSAHTIELLGCSIEELWIHLERKFVVGMTRENYGEWHVDHIKPCASFDLTDPEQQKECFNYKNLQPLWAYDNMSKGAKYEKV
jgi:hypothetical protein